MKTRNVVDPANITDDPVEDKIEAGYQLWKSEQDFLVIDEEEWETGDQNLHRIFYYTGVDDPGEEPRPGTYTARVLDNRIQVIIDMGVQE